MDSVIVYCFIIARGKPLQVRKAIVVANPSATAPSQGHWRLTSGYQAAISSTIAVNQGTLPKLSFSLGFLPYNVLDTLSNLFLESPT